MGLYAVCEKKLDNQNRALHHGWILGFLDAWILSTLYAKGFCLFVCLVKYNPNSKTPGITSTRGAWLPKTVVPSALKPSGDTPSPTRVSNRQVDGLVRLTGLTQVLIDVAFITLRNDLVALLETLYT